MIRMTERLAALLAMAILLSTAPAAAEMLDISALGDVEEAQQLDENDAQREWTYPIPYELLMTSE